ncbi:hypothetical protein [Streptomyces sp. M92]|uniref:hypothetical protein n=1 Tax=Streptomyces sp. M92 TaxID=2944250 RepID=UPI0023495FCB|nr:hypothetical protein [Streptomyces sp. M92]WCN06037.1 hypothetical protein M6G08_30340 [Streptomyces sp. M92]
MAGRYHLTLTALAQPLMHGWWNDENVARRKFTSWVGQHSDRPDARITLTDEETGTKLTEWPDPR